MQPRRRRCRTRRKVDALIAVIGVVCASLVLECEASSNATSTAAPASGAHRRLFSVIRVAAPNSTAQLTGLVALRSDIEFDFWRSPAAVHQGEAHIMAQADGPLERLLASLDTLGLRHDVMIPDVEGKIREQRARHERLLHSERRLRDWRDGKITFNLAQYHSFAEVINYMNALAVTYPEKVQVMPIGTTHEGRQIPLIKIGSRTGRVKRAIWVDGGIHAREWVSPAVVLYFINQLVTGYDKDPLIRRFVDELDWYLVPLLNPDGYEHSRSSTDPETRLWRKNRSPRQCVQVNTGLFTPPRTQCCQGVDLNRNFDWFFGQVGSSTDPCSEIYQGAYAFSEPETRAVRDFVSKRTGTIRTFLTFHSYSQILMYPFGHQVRTYSNDLNELRSTAQAAAQALSALYGTAYKVGTGADTLYPASGGSEDWAKGKMHMKYSYLFELRPEEQVWDGFLLPENQIIPTCRETWEAVKVIALQTMSLPPAVARAPRVRCADKESLCKTWAAAGTCNSWPEMRTKCPRSCNFCKVTSKRNDDNNNNYYNNTDDEVFGAVEEIVSS